LSCLVLSCIIFKTDSCVESAFLFTDRHTKQLFRVYHKFYSPHTYTDVAAPKSAVPSPRTLAPVHIFSSRPQTPNSMSRTQYKRSRPVSPSAAAAVPVVSPRKFYQQHVPLSKLLQAQPQSYDQWSKVLAVKNSNKCSPLDLEQQQQEQEPPQIVGTDMESLNGEDVDSNNSNTSISSDESDEAVAFAMGELVLPDSMWQASSMCGTPRGIKGGIPSPSVVSLRSISPRSHQSVPHSGWNGSLSHNSARQSPTSAVAQTPRGTRWLQPPVSPQNQSSTKQHATSPSSPSGLKESNHNVFPIHIGHRRGQSASGGGTNSAPCTPSGKRACAFSFDVRDSGSPRSRQLHDLMKSMFIKYPRSSWKMIREHENRLAGIQTICR
jgi:hypothetical protein